MAMYFILEPITYDPLPDWAFLRSETKYVKFRNYAPQVRPLLHKPQRTLMRDKSAKHRGPNTSIRPAGRFKFWDLGRPFERFGKCWQYCYLASISKRIPEVLRDR